MDDENRRLKSIKLCDICGSRWNNLESTDCINCFPQSKLNYFQKFNRLFDSAGNLITTFIIFLILAFCFFYFSYFNKHDDTNLYMTKTIDIESPKQIIKSTDENLYEFNPEKVNGHLSITYSEFENNILILNLERNDMLIKFGILPDVEIFFTPKESVPILNKLYCNSENKVNISKYLCSYPGKSHWGSWEINRWNEKEIQIEIDFNYMKFPEGVYTIYFLGIERDYLDSKESVYKDYKNLLQIYFSNYN